MPPALFYDIYFFLIGILLCSLGVQASTLVRFLSPFGTDTYGCGTSQSNPCLTPCFSNCANILLDGNYSVSLSTSGALMGNVSFSSLLGEATNVNINSPLTLNGDGNSCTLKLSHLRFWSAHSLPALFILRPRGRKSCAVEQVSSLLVEGCIFEGVHTESSSRSSIIGALNVLSVDSVVVRATSFVRNQAVCPCAFIFPGQFLDPPLPLSPLCLTLSALCFPVRCL